MPGREVRTCGYILICPSPSSRQVIDTIREWSCSANPADGEIRGIWYAENWEDAQGSIRVPVDVSGEIAEWRGGIEYWYSDTGSESLGQSSLDGDFVFLPPTVADSTTVCGNVLRGLTTSLLYRWRHQLMP